MTRACGFLGCEKPATSLIRQPFDEDLYRCGTHVAKTAEVHSKFANRQTEGVRVVRLPRKDRA